MDQDFPHIGPSYTEFPKKFNLQCNSLTSLELTSYYLNISYHISEGWWTHNTEWNISCYHLLGCLHSHLVTTTGSIIHQVMFLLS